MKKYTLEEQRQMIQFIDAHSDKSWVNEIAEFDHYTDLYYFLKTKGFKLWRQKKLRIKNERIWNNN